MVQLNNKRGLVLKYGKSTYLLESLFSQLLTIFLTLIVCGLLLFHAYNIYIEKEESFILVLFVISGTIWFLFLSDACVSLEKTKIYEKGITNTRSFLHSRFIGKSFVQYEKIKCIVFDYVNNEKDIQYIFIMDEKSTLLPIFIDEQLTTEYLNELFKTLKIKCSNVRFVELSLNKMLKILNDKNRRKIFNQQTKEYLTKKSNIIKFEENLI